MSYCNTYLGPDDKKVRLLRFVDNYIYIYTFLIGSDLEFMTYINISIHGAVNGPEREASWQISGNVE